MIRVTAPSYALVSLSKPELNARAGVMYHDFPFPEDGFNSVAHKAGDKTTAISTDSAMADTIVTENWR